MKDVQTTCTQVHVQNICKSEINCKGSGAHKVHAGGRSCRQAIRQTGGQTNFYCLLLL